MESEGLIVGMDLYIIRKKNVGTPNEISEEVFYSRRFWELLDAHFVKEYKESKSCSVKARITSIENFEELIDIATHNRNYWDNYNDVAKLCEARDDYEEKNEDGWTYYLEAYW